MTLHKTVVMFGVVLLGAAHASDVKPICRQLEGTKPQAHLAYLEGERAALNDACIIYAMDQLAAARYEPAVNLLVKYLDYRIPEEPKSGEPEIQRAIPWVGTKYPAARALFVIGKPAIPALIDAIASADTSALVRKNVIELVLLIHRDEVTEGAVVLNRAGRSATNPEVRQRLLDAARELAAKCPEPERGVCLSNALK